MNIKSLLAKPFAGFIQNKIQKGFKTAVEDQESILLSLIKDGKKNVYKRINIEIEIRTQSKCSKGVLKTI